MSSPTVHGQSPIHMEVQYTNLTSHDVHNINDPQQVFHNQNRILQEELEARFTTELERINEAIGYNSLVTRQPHTTIERVAHLTGILEGISPIQNTQIASSDINLDEPQQINNIVIPSANLGLDTQTELLDSNF